MLVFTLGYLSGIGESGGLIFQKWYGSIHAPSREPLADLRSALARRRLVVGIGLSVSCGSPWGRAGGAHGDCCVVLERGWFVNMEAMRSPAIWYGETTASAPARCIFAAAASLEARATTCRSARSPFAVSTM